jgi:hypothetical protein
MIFRISAVAVVFSLVFSPVLVGSAQAQVRSLKFPDPRGEFVRLCAPHMMGRWAHPESVCGCLHDYAAAAVEDTDLREALLRGISETGVPTIETEWVPPSKQSEIGATFTKIAKPTLQCMFEPSSQGPVVQGN